MLNKIAQFNIQHGPFWVESDILHLNRLAYIYVRQSSPKQVAQHVESQHLQYQLTQQAEALGWRAEQVRVMDDDQGLSAKDSAGREGYQELVAEVSLYIHDIHHSRNGNTC